MMKTNCQGSGKIAVISFLIIVGLSVAGVIAALTGDNVRQSITDKKLLQSSSEASAMPANTSTDDTAVPALNEEINQ